MHFHAEVPLVTFLALMHLRITLAVLVLGRGRSCDQGRIDDRAAGRNRGTRERRTARPRRPRQAG